MNENKEYVYMIGGGRIEKCEIVERTGSYDIKDRLKLLEKDIWYVPSIAILCFPPNYARMGL